MMLRLLPCALLVGSCLAQQALVANIEVEDWVAPSPSDGTLFVAAGSKIYFRSSHGPWTSWVTDGTRAGTRPMTNRPCYSIVPFGGGDRVLTSCDIPGIGREPCLYDGATFQLSVVKDVRPGPAQGMTSGQLTVLDDYAYFAANEPVHGLQIWRTDGSEAGTEPATDMVFTGLGTIVAANTALFFVGRTAATGMEFWRYDPATGVTTSAGEVIPGTGSPIGLMFLTPFGDGLLFQSLATGSSTGYYTDGSTMTQLPAAARSPRAFTDLGNGVAVFAASDTSNRAQLWRTDGTAGGSVQLTANTNSNATIGPFVSVGGRAVFPASIGSSGSTPVELWTSDGTAAGTHLATPTGAYGSGFFPKNLVPVGNEVWYAASAPGIGNELFHTDGITAGLLADLLPGSASSFPEDLADAGNGRVIMNTRIGSPTPIPTISDGTLAGTLTLVTPDFSNGDSFPTNFTQCGNRVVFSAQQHSFDSYRRVYVTDGTPQNTARLEDPGPGTSGGSPIDFRRFGQVTLFTAQPSVYRALWRTDGTPAGTYELGGALVAEPTTFAGESLAVFRGHGPEGNELWIADGTPTGTHLLADINPNGDSSPTALCAIGDLVCFRANDGVHGTEPWVSDGTAAGTVQLADINPGIGSAGPGSMVAVGDVCFFAAQGPQGAELWRTNGTPAGTLLVTDLNSGPASSNPDDLVTAAGLLFFSADDGSGIGRALWVTDGTSAGTTLVADFVAGNSLNIVEAAGTKNGLFLILDDGTGRGECLFFSDGTPAGTERILDLGPSTYGGFRHPTLTTILGGSMVAFAADDLVHGMQVWVSAGTAASTQRLSSIGLVGAADISDLAAIGNSIYASVDEEVNGTEPWRFEVGATQIAFTAFYGDGCHGATSPAITIGANGTPVIGDATFGIELQGADVNTAGFLFYSRGMLSQSACSLAIMPPIEFHSAHVVNAGITTTAPLPIPNHPALAGADLFWQWAMLHPSPGFVGLFDLTGGMQTHLGF
ncbi:MAG: hypothetical protein H6835_00850 [Planctomycetes bacterium]|nr:hypothetical protein [Planctomycetota bacterium]